MSLQTWDLSCHPFCLTWCFHWSQSVIVCPSRKQCRSCTWLQTSLPANPKVRGLFHSVTGDIHLNEDHMLELILSKACLFLPLNSPQKLTYSALSKGKSAHYNQRASLTFIKDINYSGEEFAVALFHWGSLLGRRQTGNQKQFTTNGLCWRSLKMAWMRGLNKRRKWATLVYMGLSRIYCPPLALKAGEHQVTEKHGTEPSAASAVKLPLNIPLLSHLLSCISILAGK